MINNTLTYPLFLLSVPLNRLSIWLILQHLWENLRDFSVDLLKLDSLSISTGWLNSVNTLYLADSATTTVAFRSPIAIAVESWAINSNSTKLSAAQIAFYLVQHLTKFNEYTAVAELNFEVQITEAGWIEYHLKDTSLARWLDYHLTAYIPQSKCKIKYNSSKNYFPLQYIHARCCGILRLAQQENLIDLPANWTELGIVRAWPWLNQTDRWLLNTRVELDLLHQIITVAHAWDSSQKGDWYRQAADLGACWLNFDRYSTIIGKSNCHLARIGLTAIAQFWLYRLLQQLGIEAVAIL